MFLGHLRVLRPHAAPCLPVVEDVALEDLPEHPGLDLQQLPKAHQLEGELVRDLASHLEYHARDALNIVRKLALNSYHLMI